MTKIIRVIGPVLAVLGFAGMAFGTEPRWVVALFGALWVGIDVLDNSAAEHWRRAYKLRKTADNLAEQKRKAMLS